VGELAAALGVGYRPDGQGGLDHAAVISLLDAKREIVLHYSGAERGRVPTAPGRTEQSAGKAQLNLTRY
jgi:hypothetical protein